jgi:ABC-type amino acid transport system permease subunit
VTANDYLGILQAALATVSMSLVSILLGVPLGLGLGLIRWSRLPLLNQLTMAYVSLGAGGNSHIDAEHGGVQYRNLAQRAH